MSSSIAGSNVLFLTQVLPYPLSSGAKIRAYYMLRYLAQHYRVTLVSFVREDDRPEYVEHLQYYCHDVHTVRMQRSTFKDIRSLLEGLMGKKPAVIARDRKPAMLRLLRQLVKRTEYAVVHADQTSMAQYGLFAARTATNSPAMLLDQHNAMHLLVARQAAHERGWRQRIWQREARLLRKYETGLLRQYSHILTVTEEDTNALGQLLPPAEQPAFFERHSTLPICVDPASQPMVEQWDEGHHILHLGTMFWPPNIEGVLWFAREVLPRILNEIPDARFTIAGKNPPAAVKALAERGSLVAGHVEVTGFVPDPAPLLRRSRVFVVPFWAGGGMRVKILDGWQWGVPIVSTPIGAEGILCQPGENILLADDADTFANAVVRVMRDRSLARQLRDSGRRWVEAQYNWRTVYPKLDSIYGALCDSQTKNSQSHEALASTQ